jgi:hypothetical protein
MTLGGDTLTDDDILYGCDLTEFIAHFEFQVTELRPVYGS